MAHEVLLPKQGNSVESCIIIEWSIGVGDTVTEGQKLCEVETDKATFEVESTATGTVLKLLYDAGDEAPVMQPIAIVGEEGEQVDVSGAAAAAHAAPPSPAVTADASTAAGQGAPSPAVTTGATASPAGGQGPPSPAVTAGADASTATGQGPAAGQARASGQGGASGQARATGEGPAAGQGFGPGQPAAGGSTAARTPSGKLRISPRARQQAERCGVDPQQLAGSGPGGRILVRDVERAIAEGTAQVTGGAGAGAPGGQTAADRTGGAAADARAGAPGGQLVGAGSAAPGGMPAGSAASGGAPGGRDAAPGGQTVSAGSAAAAGTAGPAAAAAGSAVPLTGAPNLGDPAVAGTTPLRGIRAVIAERMHASLRDTAQLTMDMTADARGLKRLRARFKESAEQLGLPSVSIGEMVAFAAARTLMRHPALNSHMQADSIVHYRDVHLGLAVDTDRGLMVPTIRGANARSLSSLAEEGRRLAAAARNGSIGPDELTGATFTITNLGATGVNHFTPVLNPPQVAILGVGGIRPEPRFIDNPATAGPDAGEYQVEHIPVIGLSLTIDHRAVDGAPASRFLKDLCDAIAAIELTLAI